MDERDEQSERSFGGVVLHFIFHMSRQLCHSVNKFTHTFSMEVKFTHSYTHTPMYMEYAGGLKQLQICVKMKENSLRTVPS